jgi:ubiquinone/menaquinone biosynthesis C-methylase UbiE
MNIQKKHWETIYTHKQPNEVSWTQKIPQTSLQFISDANLPKSASIIDIGGGDSNLVDYLLEEGYSNISVLDISEFALQRAKHRLGEKAQKVKWIVNDVLEFKPNCKYDFWHDRAAFHFLTTELQITQYLSTARSFIQKNGTATISTFSELGPTKCSGLAIQQYSEETLSSELNNGFEKIKCLQENHITPFNTTQNFLYCSFKRKFK